MNYQAISHIAIGVRDMERSLAFYRDILGLKVSADRIEEFPQGEGQEPTRRRAVFLRWVEGPHATYILLDQNLVADPGGEAKQLYQRGIHHFGFWVEDMKAIMRRARAAGVDVAVGHEDSEGAPSEWYGEPEGQGLIKAVIMRDPEGNFVQLDQRV